MTERGEIRNRIYSQQVHDFRGLRWGNITPMDIDGFLDFGDRLFVFIETKYCDTQCDVGQRIALERLCNACHSPPIRLAIAYIVRHETRGDIDVGNCAVSRYYWNSIWYVPKAGLTLREAITVMLQRIHEPHAA